MRRTDEDGRDGEATGTTRPGLGPEQRTLFDPARLGESAGAGLWRFWSDRRLEALIVGLRREGEGVDSVSEMSRGVRPPLMKGECESAGRQAVDRGNGRSVGGADNGEANSE